MAARDALAGAVNEDEEGNGLGPGLVIAAALVVAAGVVAVLGVLFVRGLAQIALWAGATP